MVTMQQIADRCGVSRGTVDRALHHKEGVREEVAERIRATAREMGYISNRLVMQQTQQWKIGVVLHSGHSPFVQMLCELFESFSERELLPNITAVPDKGYTLESLTVLDKDGKALELTDKGGGKYTFVMPAGKIAVKAVFMDDNTMLNFFTDVHAEDYYYDAVLWAAQKGITGGMSDTLFAPNAACTRAQIVTFLWRAAGSPEPSALSNFNDVPADKYYAKAVAWAVENGITNGTTDTTFSPDDICTRAHGVTFLYRAAKATASVGASAFTDVADSAYYADAVKWATEQGITKDISSTLFGLDETCTRAQIVTFLYRLYGSK